MRLSLRPHCWPLLAALALSQPGRTASPTPAIDTLERMLALPVASELAGARDAATFAWVENAAGVRNVWIGGPGRSGRQVTAFAQDDGQLLYDVAISNDGGTLAFVRGGDPEYADEDLPNAGNAAAPPAQRLFVAGTKGGTATAIGDGHSPVFAPDGRIAFTRKGEIWLWQPGRSAVRLAGVAGEVRRLSWSPDGRTLAFVDHRDDHSFVALLDVATARLRYVGAGLGFSVEPAFSPDGSRLAFIHFVEPPPGAPPSGGGYWSIYLADTASGINRLIWAAPPGEGARFAAIGGDNLQWSADGRLLFPWESNGWLHVHSVGTAGGPARDLTPGAFEVDSFVLTRDRRSLVYAANAGDLDRRHLWRQSLSGGAAVQLSRGDGIESRPTFGGDALALIAADASHPAYPALVDALAPLGPLAAATGFVAPTSVTFRAADGVEVHGQFFAAKGPGKHPAIVYVHGGPRRQMVPGFHPSGYYSIAYVFNQYLAGRGYDVLSVNYRSGTGYGHAFREAAGIGREGASEYGDVLAGARWLAARAQVDPKRIGIWGGSWGGYLTALALARNSEIFAAGVDFHGVHSLLRPVADSLSPAAQAAARDLQWQASPLAAIDRWRSPILLIHGDDDRNVKFSQSLLLARELSARQIPFRDLVFPNERHGFLRHANWLQGFRAASDFMDREVRDKRAVP